MVVYNVVVVVGVGVIKGVIVMEMVYVGIKNFFIGKIKLVIIV